METKPFTNLHTHDGVRWFGSLSEFGEACQHAKPQGASGSWCDWAGGSWDSAMRKLRSGDDSAVPEAESMLKDINDRLDLSGLSSRWNTSPVGAFPHVPAFLAGQPESMWARMPEASKDGEVRFVFCPTSFHGYSVENLRKRGVAVLAAAMALSRIRKVEVWVVSAMEMVHQFAVRMASPIILSESAYAMADTVFDRKLVHDLGYAEEEFTGGWAIWQKIGTLSDARRVVDLADEDVWSPPVMRPGIKSSAEERDLNQIVEDPVKWINGLLDRYRM